MMEATPMKFKYIVEYRLKGQEDWKYYNASSKEDIARKYMDEAKDLDGVVDVRLRAKISQSQILETWEKGRWNG